MSWIDQCWKEEQRIEEEWTPRQRNQGRFIQGCLVEQKHDASQALSLETEIVRKKRKLDSASCQPLFYILPHGYIWTNVCTCIRINVMECVNCFGRGLMRW
mmetsp:Transcript_13543/g.16415  ORF Transcript_13543/g.16415 Transcript_13543/m.16415 type:complete len:101 (+) Transcript_13543:677-979(+)